MALRIGFARHDITPPLGLPLGGYGARTGGAVAVLDPLFCRAAVLDEGTAHIAIVVLDLVHVFGAWVADVRTRIQAALGIAPERCLIAATHTHAGPGVFRSTLTPDERIAVYERTLADDVVACVIAADRAAEPAALRFGGAPAHGVAANRRDATLPIDETVRVVSAYGPSGRLLGVIANFACHPTVLSAANHGYSSDLFGAAVASATQALDAPVLLTNGAAGDVSTRFTRHEQTHAEVQRLGDALASAMTAAVRAAAPVRATPLGGATHSVPVWWRPLPAPDAAAAQLQTAFAELEALAARGVAPRALRVAQTRVEGAQAELWIASQGGWEALFGPRPPLADVQALRCGDVRLIAAPGELFATAGAWVQRQLGEFTLVIGYANDYLGYFIPPADAAAGGYEALIAMLDPACEAAVRGGLLEMAKAVGDTERTT